MTHWSELPWWRKFLGWTTGLGLIAALIFLTIVSLLAWNWGAIALSAAIWILLWALARSVQETTRLRIRLKELERLPPDQRVPPSVLRH